MDVDYDRMSPLTHLLLCGLVYLNQVDGELLFMIHSNREL